MWEEDDEQTQQEDRSTGSFLTGDPETLHVFVVREGVLSAFFPPVVESTLSGSSPRSSFSSGPSPPAARLIRTGRLWDRGGTILGILTLILLLAGIVALIWSLLMPQPEVLVRLIPRTWNVSLLRTIPPGTPHIPARVLAPVTVAQRLTVAATGTGHAPATSARGQITFYNGAFETQAVAAGTTLVGQDGVVIVTDTAALIPAARPTNPPTYGQASVAAHAAVAGVAGNIAAFDISQTCCATGVLAKNMTAFSGGEPARTFRVVAQADIDRTTRQLVPSVQGVVQVQLRAALKSGEQLALLPCRPRATANANVGQAASVVTVTVTATCQSIAYRQAALQAQALWWLEQEAESRAKMAVQPAGVARVRLSSVALVNGRAALTVAASGQFLPVWSVRQLQHMTRAIAGKPVAWATRWLLAQPGVSKVQITGTSRTTLPQNPASIHLLVEEPLPEPAASSTVSLIRVMRRSGKPNEKG